MKTFYTSIFIATLSFSFISQTAIAQQEAAEFHYNLDKPDQVFSMPSELQEISGIDFLDKNKIVCVQDELGIIYTFNPQSAKADATLQFEKKGDFEEIALVGKDAFVLESDGTIYHIKDFQSKDSKTKKYETSLKEKNDAEGLCYDEDNKRLLVSCKELDNEKFSDKKVILSWDLSSKSLDKKTPAFHIDLEELKLFINPQAKFSFSQSLLASLDGKNIEKVFKPSGLAIHPITKQLYIISSTNKLLVVLTPQSRIQHVIPLSEGLFLQPEGITFSPEGDLYISNEGKKGKAEGNILKFIYAR